MTDLDVLLAKASSDVRHSVRRKGVSAPAAISRRSHRRVFAVAAMSVLVIGATAALLTGVPDRSTSLQMGSAVTSEMILRDGVVSEEEYRAGAEAVVSCLAEAGIDTELEYGDDQHANFSFQEPGAASNGAQGDELQRCMDTHLSDNVELGWSVALGQVHLRLHSAETAAQVACVEEEAGTAFGELSYDEFGYLTEQGRQTRDRAMAYQDGQAWAECADRPIELRAGLPALVASAQRAMILAERAGNVLIEQCMEDKGFEYQAVTGTDVGVSTSGLMVSALTVEVAAEEGYGPYVLVPGQPAPSEEIRQAGREHFQSLSEAEQQRYLRALEGEGDRAAVMLDSGVSVVMGGCVGESRRQLLGERVLDIFNTFHTVQFLQVDVSADPAVRQAEQEWESCMRQSGFGFDRPQAAVEAALAMRGNATEPSSEEITMAVADAECRVQSGIIEATEAAFIALNQQALQEHQHLLGDWAEMEQMVLDRAGDVLGVDLTDDQ